MGQTSEMGQEGMAWVPPLSRGPFVGTFSAKYLHVLFGAGNRTGMAEGKVTEKASRAASSFLRTETTTTWGHRAPGSAPSRVRDQILPGGVRVDGAAIPGLLLVFLLTPGEAFKGQDPVR